MIGFSILEELFTNVLETGLVSGVYHSVKMKPLDTGGVKPAAPVKGRFVYVGLDDTKGFSCYCRENGSATVSDIENIGGCNTKKYRFEVPHKIVFFNMSEKRDHDAIAAKLIKSVLKTKFVRVQKMTTIPEEIIRSEAPTGRFNFREHTFYFSIDFFVLLDIQADTCEEQMKCEGVPNPFCL